MYFVLCRQDMKVLLSLLLTNTYCNCVVTCLLCLLQLGHPPADGQELCRHLQDQFFSVVLSAGVCLKHVGLERREGVARASRSKPSAAPNPRLLCPSPHLLQFFSQRRGIPPVFFTKLVHRGKRTSSLEENRTTLIAF